MKLTKKLTALILIGILLGIGVVLTPATASAKPTIHALLVIMDGDTLNAEQYEKSGSKIGSLLRDVKNTVCNLKLTELRSDSDNVSQWPTNDRILQWVREVRPQKDDVVFIYFCGHGGKANINNDSTFGGTFFDLDSSYLLRKDLVNTLKAAPAWQCRLKMIITDTCSAEVSSLIDVEQYFGAPPPFFKDKEPVYRQLFVEHEGFLHLTSATEGEYSWGDSEKGGWFTHGLVASIDSYGLVTPDSYASLSAASGFVEWKTIFEDAKKEVERLTALYSLKVGTNLQHPKYYGSFPKRVSTHKSTSNLNNGNGSTPKAHIQKVWVDHNQYEDGLKGMRIHVKFDVDNFKGREGRVNAYFYTKNGDALKDFNESYRTKSGKVSVGKRFTPGSVNAPYNDFQLFMPNYELHVRGKHDLKFRIQIFNPNTSTALSDNSDWVHFTCTAPEAHIQKVWVDHNQYEDGLKGMRIHVKFDVDNFKGSEGRVNAYFYTKNGDALKDFNESYRTKSGEVSVGKRFTPGSVSTPYNDFQLFMPNHELHMVSGKHDLKFRIQIFNPNTSTALSDNSDWVHFTYTK